MLEVLSNPYRTLALYFTGCTLQNDKTVFVRSNLDSCTGWNRFGHSALCLVCGHAELVPEIPADGEIRYPADSQQVHDRASHRHRQPRFRSETARKFQGRSLLPPDIRIGLPNAHGGGTAQGQFGHKRCDRAEVLEVHQLHSGKVRCNQSRGISPAGGVTTLVCRSAVTAMTRWSGSRSNPGVMAMSSCKAVHL